MFAEPGSRFRAAAPNHPEALLLEEPQIPKLFKLLGEGGGGEKKKVFVPGIWHTRRFPGSTKAGYCHFPLTSLAAGAHGAREGHGIQRNGELTHLLEQVQHHLPIGSETSQGSLKQTPGKKHWKPWKIVVFLPFLLQVFFLWKYGTSLSEVSSASYLKTSPFLPPLVCRSLFFQPTRVWIPEWPHFASWEVPDVQLHRPPLLHEIQDGRARSPSIGSHSQDRPTLLSHLQGEKCDIEKRQKPTFQQAFTLQREPDHIKELISAYYSTSWLGALGWEDPKLLWVRHPLTAAGPWSSFGGRCKWSP